MSRLDYRQQKIQEKRKQTPWREFLMEIASWRTVSFYKNNNLISKYPVSNRKLNIVSPTDADKILGASFFGLSHDLTTSFFDQFFMLFQNVSLPSLMHYGKTENADYSDTVYNARNIYLSNMVTGDVENVLYSFSVKDNSSYVINSVNIIKSQYIYQCVSVSNSFSVFFSSNILDSSDIRNSYNLVGCNHCINCSNLKNKSYCIDNMQYSQEDFLENMKVKPLQTLTAHKVDEVFMRHCDDCIGDNLENCNHVQHAYYCINTTYARNIAFITSNEQTEYLYDVFAGGAASDFYAVCDCGGFCDNFYCVFSGGVQSSHLYYCINMESCSYCFGCIGLKNKSFCILNKQYTKEERYEKVDEIFGQMEKEGTLGQFFPATMNPFYFNDTAAYLIDPSFTKEEVTAKGYLRRDEPIKVDIPAGVQTVKTSDLDQFEGFDAVGNRAISDEILKKVILDEEGNAYRVIPMELEFLRKHGLPLPRKHWLDRMKENFRIN